MKNFTNNFKQFTSRLSARWLIMALMMLVGTSSAWGADLYIHCTTNTARAWIWVEGGSNYSGNDWNNRPKLNNTTYFTSLGNNWYKYKKQSLPSKVSIILTAEGGGTEARYDNLALTSYIHYVSGGSSIEVYGAPGGYNIAGSFTNWATNAKSFTSYSDSKQAYTMAAIELSADTHKLKIRKGSTWYGSSHDNSRGNLTFSNKDGEGNITFTLSTAKKVTFYYDPGADKVFADATDACSAPTSVSIARSDAPSTANICQGSTIDLTANVDGSGDITYKWETVSGTDWSVSANSTSQTCTVTAGTGSATFKITATRCGTSKTNTIDLTADAKPTLTLESNPTICQGDQITLSDYVAPSSTGTVKWYSNSGMTEEITNPSVARTPQSNPTYYYARATNGVCSAVDKKLTVTVRATPTKYTVSEGSAENKVKLSNSQSNYTYTLYNENGEKVGNSITGSTGTALEWPVSVAGTYTVKARYTGSDCAETAMNGSYTYTPCTPADYTVSFANSATTVNKGSTLQASVSPSGTGHGNVTWSSSATAVATVDNSGLITGVKGGQATITATVAKGDTYCGGSATKTITVKETPSVTILGDKEFCTSTTLTATVTGITAGVSYSIAWYKEGGANPVATGSTYSAKETGTYTAKVTGTYINERISAGYAVTKKSAPATPDIKFTPNPVKEGTVTVLSIENYDPNNTYQFNGPDDLQGTMTQTTEFELSAGSYAFTVTATSKACPSVTATSETETLTVQEGGVAIDILGDEAIYSDDPTDFVAMYVTEKNGMADFPDAEGIAISSYTWEYSANGTSNWAACKEYDNATLGVKNSGSKCNNLRPNKVGYYRCVINYIDGAENYVGSLTSNVLQVTQAGTNPNTSSGKNQHIKTVGGNWTLPVISVNTGDKDFPTCSAGSYPSAQTDNLKKKRSVDVKIFNPDGTVYYDRKARMNYRGSSSLNFKKKSYAFCPGKENCGDDEDGADYVKTSKENLFGLSNGAKDKDWVLYAAAADPSLMRNRVVFNTFKEMTGKWGVDTKYVELVVNGVYQGVYVLMDKITANENRVNITDKNGFIVKFDKTDVEDREKSLLEGGMEVGDEKTFMTTRTGRLGIITYGTKVDQLFEIEYPEKEDIEEDGGSWAATLNFIKQKFEQFETALAKSDYATVRNLIDYQSWADWFIINEYTKNVDAYRASCVFVYNGDKIEVMPLWDQELSFKNQAGADIWKKGCDNTNGLLIQHEGVYTDCFPAPFWFIGKTVNFGSCGGNNGNSTITGTIGGYLINDACFVNTIKQRWTYHMQNSLSSTELKKKVDAYTSELTTAIKRESKRWSDDFRCNAECGGGTGYNSQSYDNSLKTLNEWITGNRTTNLTAAIENLNGASSAGITITMEPTTGITTPWVPVKVLVNAPTSATIKYDDTSITEGITEKKDKAIKTVNDKLYTYIFPRPTSWGTGNVATPIEQKTYEIRAILTNASDDCPGVSNEAVATIKLADEGNDNCVENK